MSESSEQDEPNEPTTRGQILDHCLQHVCGFSESTSNHLKEQLRMSSIQRFISTNDSTFEGLVNRVEHTVGDCKKTTSLKTWLLNYQRQNNSFPDNWTSSLTPLMIETSMIQRQLDVTRVHSAPESRSGTDYPRHHCTKVRLSDYPTFNGKITTRRTWQFSIQERMRVASVAPLGSSLDLAIGRQRWQHATKSH